MSGPEGHQRRAGTRQWPFAVVVRYVRTNAPAWTRDFDTRAEADGYADRVRSDHVWSEVRENDCPSED